MTRALVVALDHAPRKGAPTHNGNNREEGEEGAREEGAREEGAREEGAREEGAREEGLG